MGGINLESLESDKLFKIYKESLNLIKHSFIIINANNFKTVAINKKMALSLGKTEDELIGKNILDFFPAKTAKIRKKYAEMVIKTKKPQFFEDERNGRWFLNHFYPLIDGKNNVTHGIVFVEEISNKKKFESEFKKREIELYDINKKLKIITEHMTDLVFQITLTGKFTFVNSVSERYGYKTNEMIGKNFTKFVPKKELPRYFSQIKKMISGEKIDNFESKVTHKNGTIIPTEFSGQMVKVGKKRYINGIMRNIQLRKKLEYEKKKIDKRYKLILENSNCPVTYLDLKGNIILINELGAKNLNSTKKQLIGKSIFEILPEFAEEQKKRIKLVIKNDAGIKRVDLIKLSDSEKWFLSDIQPVKNDLNEIIGVQIFSVDITDQKKMEIELKASEKKWQSLTNNLPTDDRILIIDNKFNIQYINRVTSGRDIKSIIGQNMLDYVTENNRPIVKDNIISVFKTRKPRKYESISVTPSGDEEIYDVVAAPMIENDYVKSVVIIARNITDQKKSEKSLRESEEKYSSLFQNSNDSIIIHDLKGKILDVNNQALNLFGYKKKEILSKKIIDLHPPYATESSKSAFKEILLKDSIKFEIDFIKKNNEIFSSEISSSIYKIGNIKVVQGIIRDITKRKKTEEEIKKSKNYLQNVIDSTLEVIFTVDSNYKIRTWNKTAEKIIGIKKKYIVDKYLKQINVFDNQVEIREYIKKILQDKKGSLTEITVNTQYGTKRIFSVSISYLRDILNNISEFLFVCRDITLEKELFGKLKFGNNYIISEKVMSTSLEIFKGLINKNTPGLYIGRKIDEKVKNELINKNVKILKLSDYKTNEISVVTTLEDLYNSIKDFVKVNNKSILLLGRVDYLINNYSFEKLIKMLYKINDLILKNQSILLLRVNPSIVNEVQSSILYEEFEKVPSQKIKDVQLSEELFEILEYIQRENMMNKIVSYSKIGSMFHISKITVKNRIESLLENGLIYVKKQGKIKSVNITEKGKNILIQ